MRMDASQAPRRVKGGARTVDVAGVERLVRVALALALGAAGTVTGVGTAAGAAPPAPAADAPAPGTPAPGTPAPGTDEPTAPPAVTRVDLHLPDHPSAADLARVRRAVTDLTAEATRLAGDVDSAAASSASLRVQLGRAADARDAARERLDDAVRRTYMASGGDRVVSFVAGWSPADEDAAHAAARRQLHVDSGLLRDSATAGAAVVRLSAQATAYRSSLLRAAVPVEATQARARDALAQAERAFADDQAALAALAEQRAQLDAVSTQVAFAVTPAVSTQGRSTAAAQLPVLELLARTPLGALPAGYHQTGTTFAGSSSWYGPGFVGSPTASGSPYNPDQLTCAMLTMPLGTVVRVTTGAGRVVTVLVTDRGPYVPGSDRIIDLSAAAARLAGVGVTPVTVEVLEPDGPASP